VAKGERALAARRALRFLERRPNDPHASRVRELAGERLAPAGNAGAR
jgi:hypothetical protein